MKRRVLTTAALILGPFAVISLAIQSATSKPPEPAPPRVCIHHAHVRTTVSDPNSPSGHITVRRTRTWCDEWSDR